MSDEKGTHRLRIDGGPPENDDVPQRPPRALRHATASTMDQEPLGVTAAELERHAAELGDHLARQQTALDEREALIHSQLAALENQRRRLRSREEQRMSQTRAGAQGDPASSTEREHSRELEEQSAKLARAELQVRDERRELAQQTEAASALKADLEKRLEAVVQVERELGSQYHQLEAQRESLSREREQLRQERDQFETECSERGQARSAQWEQRLRRLEAEGDRQARRGEAQARVRNELAAMQREMLELGIALQEVWAELAKRLSLPVLSQSLLQVRAQLADTYRIEREALAEDRHQLQQLAKRLAEHKGQLEERSNDLHQWAERRTVELEQQAAHLVARQHELSQQEKQLFDERHRWLSERRTIESRFQLMLSRIAHDGSTPASDADADPRAA